MVKNMPVRNGLNMSKKELKKWENKLKLYMILHQYLDPYASVHCKACWDATGKCSWLSAPGKKEMLHFRWKEAKMMFELKPSANNIGFGGHTCVEWVRYV